MACCCAPTVVLLLVLAAVAASASLPQPPTQAACASIQDRVDCSSGVGSNPKQLAPLTKDQCEARGCCFANATDDDDAYCFFPAEGARVEVVHMINSNHFDAGYADLTATVVNTYFDKFFGRAADVGAALRKTPDLPGGGPLRWMTFSFMVGLYFDCPDNLGLHCPTEQEKDTIRAAIKAGDIVFPAFPHNAEVATGDASMLDFGVSYSKQLAAQLGIPQPSVLSTRDVPGMPRASLPILAKAGITALSEGMNGRIVPVNVPPAFVWRSLDGQTKLPTLWHWDGYGMLNEAGNPIRLPGSKHALAYCWRGDNAGPPQNAMEVLSNAKKLQQKFSNQTEHSWLHTQVRRGHPHSYGARGEQVKVISSSLEEFVKAVTDDSPSTWDQLPVVTQDLSDTWVWGVASDPIKTQRARAILRARTACEKDARTRSSSSLSSSSASASASAASSSSCTSSDVAYTNFSRVSIKNMEHTWGVSISHFGKQYDADWSNTDFHQQLAQKQKNLEFMASSWTEQRDWGINKPLDYLPADHPLREALEGEFRVLSTPPPSNPAASGYTPARNPTAPLNTLFGGWANITFGADGSLVQLDVTATTTQKHRNPSANTATASSFSWASRNNPLGLLQYQTLVQDDFDQWQAVYLLKGSGGGDEYGKPGGFMKSTPTPVHQLKAPKLASVWTRGTTDVLAQVSFDADLWQNYGAPVQAWLHYAFATSPAGGANLTVFLVNKTATRLPEATFITFRPTVSGTAKWEHSILGEWSSPLDVADGASKGLHYVDDAGVRASTTDGSNHRFQVAAPDAGLLRWDAPLPFPTPLYGNVNLTQGASYCLHNNIWNTNYPVWFPFDDMGKESIMFRFPITFA